MIGWELFGWVRPRMVAPGLGRRPSQWTGLAGPPLFLSPIIIPWTPDVMRTKIALNGSFSAAQSAENYARSVAIVPSPITFAQRGGGRLTLLEVSTRSWRAPRAVPPRAGLRAHPAPRRRARARAAPPAPRRVARARAGPRPRQRRRRGPESVGAKAQAADHRPFVRDLLPGPTQGGAPDDPRHAAVHPTATGAKRLGGQQRPPGELRGFDGCMRWSHQGRGLGARRGARPTSDRQHGCATKVTEAEASVHGDGRGPRRTGSTAARQGSHRGRGLSGCFCTSAPKPCITQVSPGW